MSEWMTVEEAAQYLQLGKTVLYELARENTIPSNKINNKWLFSKNDLDNWVRSTKPVERFFKETPAYIEENLNLRDPQIEAYQAAYEYFKNGGKTALIQIPVGCGKSGIAAIMPFGIAEGRVLIVTPNVTIKDGLFETLDVTNRQKCFWRTRKVLKEENMLGGPFTSTLNTGNMSVCEKSHIIVSNIHQFVANPDKWLNNFPKDFFDLIIVDEAHHSPAKSWQKVLEHFNNSKVLNMTATPFRSDNQKIDGELIYRYPFKKATFNGYVKRVKSWYVAPSELVFTANGETKTYSLDEVLEMKEKDWFSRGIALSDPCNLSIVDNSLEKLEKLRETGTHHQLIAVACSVYHAKKICSMYAERNYKCDVIHSDLDEDKQLEIKRRLKSGELDCIVQVQMLGEGFDHPKLSVAAIFRPFRTLSPYVQFIGRILRVIVQNNPTHIDNFGHIVTHAGMNIDKRLEEFRLFENDDQRFWREVVSGNDPEELPNQVTSGTARMRLSETAFANSEIVEELIEEDFTTTDDEDIIRELEAKLESLGLDPANARNLVYNKSPEKKMAPAASPYQILPQREWEQLKKQLNIKVKRVAVLLLNRLGIQTSGRELVNKGIASTNNIIAGITLINKELKRRNTKDRQEWSTEEFNQASNDLEAILNELTNRYKGILNEKTKR